MAEDMAMSNKSRGYIGKIYSHDREGGEVANVVDIVSLF
jgi:hypothetical protein